MDEIEHVPGPAGDQDLPSLVDEDDEEYEPGVHIKDGIETEQLTKDDGVTFELDPSDFNEDELEVEVDRVHPSSEFAEPSDLVSQMNAMTQFANDYEDEDGETMTPFERLSRKMIPVTNDQKVKKELVRPGIGGVVPPGSVVRVHYSGRLEYADEPFDSSYLQQSRRPKTFKLGDGSWLPGLDVAVGTMKRDETSLFLIHYDYFLGEHGCPPRIPPKATVLFRVELVSFTDRAEVGDYYSMSRAERKDVDMDIILKVVALEKKDGRECFENRNYGGALRKYKKAINILEESHLADADAEARQQKELLILYRNAANCADKVGESSRVIYYCNAALRIDPKDAKAWYFKGKGLTREMEFDRAKTALKKARMLCPNSTEITKALKELDEKFKRVSLNEKQMFQRMFQSEPSADSKEKKDRLNENKTEADLKREAAEKKVKEKKAEVDDDPLTNVSTEFQKLAREQLEEFQKNSEVTLPFPTTRHTRAEIYCLLEIACDLGLEVQEVGEGSNHHYRFSKPKPEEA